MKKMFEIIVPLATVAPEFGSPNDPFSDAQAEIDTLLAKPGALELRNRLMPNIEAALECFSVCTKTLVLHGSNPIHSSKDIAMMFVLSDLTVSAYRTSMSLDHKAFLCLCSTVDSRVNGDFSILSQHYTDLTNEFVRTATELSAS